ncbi:sugar phosphorylase, partial [bacterium]|nr:sugar phosphorylase [bacterium]
MADLTKQRDLKKYSSLSQSEIREKIREILTELYSRTDAETAFEKIIQLSEKYKKTNNNTGALFSEKDILLITYGDSIFKYGEKPLKTLLHFYNDKLKQVVSFIHILPFFPFSSDDGFSIIDYKEVNPQLGSWRDIENLGKNTKLMFDLVLNHISAKSTWFKKYLAGEKEFEHLAIEMDPDEDLSMVARPRALPLLTPFIKKDGSKVFLWTTFSEDQIDLNYKSINVLIKMIDVFLFYIQKGASMVRLDAIAYLWKEKGTACIHQRQVHLLVKLFRLITEAAQRECIILTETNVPHKQNISYFGSGHDEAHIIYNFTLPPLTLYTLLKQDSTILTKWAHTLKFSSDETTFLNFTASHDGIGLLPLKGYINDNEIEQLIEHVRENHGRVSYKTEGRKKIPYELNISYVDAVAQQNDSDETIAKKFLASQSIPLVLPGIPAVYIHSLLGSRNYEQGVELTGRARSINREKLNLEQIESELSSEISLRSRIFHSYIKMLSVRGMQPAFHPNSECEILDLNTRIFSVKRSCES